MIFWDSVPWFLPGVLLFMAVGIGASTRVAKALAVSRMMALMGTVSLGVILSATLSPLRVAIESGAISSGFCDLSRVGLVPLAELIAVTRNDTLVNVALFVPLGLVIGLVRRSGHKAALILVGVLLPFAIEITQLLVLPLARACESADVFDNLTGLALGLAAGLLVSRLQP